jgi:hypothetical protein
VCLFSLFEEALLSQAYEFNSKEGEDSAPGPGMSQKPVFLILKGTFVVLVQINVP